MSRKTSSTIFSIAATAFLVVAALVVLKKLGVDFFEPKTTVTSYTIIEQIKLVAKLQTVEYYGATAVKWEKEDWIKAKTQVLFLGQGKVVASVDLEKMGIEVSGEGDKKLITLKLPNVVVENPIVDKFEVIMSCKSFITAPEI